MMHATFTIFLFVKHYMLQFFHKFLLEFVYFYFACMGSLCLLCFPPTVQDHTGEGEKLGGGWLQISTPSDTCFIVVL